MGLLDNVVPFLSDLSSPFRLDLSGNRDVWPVSEVGPCFRPRQRAGTGPFMGNMRVYIYIYIYTHIYGYLMFFSLSIFRFISGLATLIRSLRIDSYPYHRVTTKRKIRQFRCYSIFVRPFVPPLMLPRASPTTFLNCFF